MPWRRIRRPRSFAPPEWFPNGRNGLCARPWAQSSFRERIAYTIGMMFERRLLFVTGKGGVGKSTVSGALALAATRLGKKVLLVDVGGSDVLAALFDQSTIAKAPKEIHPLIDAVRVDPLLALDEYVHTFIKTSFIADRITHSKLFEYLASGTPGLREIMTLGKIWLWEQALDTGSGAYQYDLIVVDAPATGHGLSFLQVPQVLIDMIGIGPIKEQTEDVLRLLRDRKKSAMYLVTLPEELPVNETIQLYQAASEVLQMAVGGVFINGLYPKRFTVREAAEIKRLLRTLRQSGRTQDYELPVLRSARIAIGRRTQQEFYVKRLKENIEAPFTEIPYRFDASSGLYALKEIAAGLLGSVPA